MSDTRPPLPGAPRPIEGEVLSCNRPLRALLVGFLTVNAVSCYLLCLLSLLAVLWGVREGLVGVFVWLPLGTIPAGCAWWLLTHKPGLVLGQDRLQMLLGKNVFFEVPYENIAGVGLLSVAAPLPIRALGVKLLRPEPFDAAWPRRARARRGCRKRVGFDLVFWGPFWEEPVERCREAILTCYERFLAEREAAASPSVSPGRTDALLAQPPQAEICEELAQRKATGGP